LSLTIDRTQAVPGVQFPWQSLPSAEIGTAQQEIPVDNYKIVRFYAPHLNRDNRVIKTGLTLEQAQAWCKDPSTRKEGQWFDGYTST